MGKIGYITAADIATWPDLELGGYMFNDLDHFLDSPQSYTVSNSGGLALFAKTNHGRVVGERLDIDTGSYAGHWLVNTVPTVSSFTLKSIVGGTPLTFSSSASGTYYPMVNNGFYIAQSGSHNQKNFSIGDNAQTYAYDNHNADGTLKYIHGDHGDHYTGTIGRKVFHVFPDKAATITNDGSGNVLVTYSTNHNIKRGMYGKIKFSTKGYNGYYFLERVTNTTFRIRPNATSDYVPYTVDDLAIYWCIVPGATSMTGVDIKSNNPDTDPILWVLPLSANGQVNFRKTPESNDNYGFEMFGGAIGFKTAFRYDPIARTGNINYLGWDGGLKFSRGKWPGYFEFKNYNSSNPILYFKSLCNNIVLEDIEIDGGDQGFAGSMCKDDSVATPVMKVTGRRIYSHNLGVGEGYYWGETSQQVSGSPNTSHGMNVLFEDNIAAYTGAELVQLGQMVSGSIARNFVAFCGSGEKYDPFTTGQGQGIQIRNQEGGVIIELFIVTGYNFYGIYCDSDHGNGTTGGSLTFRKFYVGEGCQSIGIFYDGGNDTTLVYEFKDFYAKNIDIYYDKYYYEAQATDSNKIILTVSSNNLTVNNGNIDSALSAYTLYDGTITNLNLPLVTRNVVQPAIEFECSGWAWMDIRNITLFVRNWDATNFNIVDLRDQRIPYKAGHVFRQYGKFWYLENDLASDAAITSSGGHALITSQEYVAGVLTPKNHGLNTGDAFTIDAGTYAGSFTVEKINATTFKFRNAGTLVNYVSDKRATYYTDLGLEPHLDSTNYTQLKWDSTGKCIKEVGYNSALTIYEYPPDDFRTKKNTLYSILGIGLNGGEQNDAGTYFEWQVAHETAGVADTSFISTVAFGKDKKLDKARIAQWFGSNMWYRSKMTVVDAAGRIATPVTSDWKKV